MASGIDWEQVECDYKAGIKTIRAIGRQYGVSHKVIITKAKRLGWERDLTDKIRLAAKTKLAKLAKKKGGTTKKTGTDEGGTKTGNGSNYPPVKEQDIIENNASSQVEIQLGQREDIRRTRSIVVSMLIELEGMTENPNLFKEVGEALSDSDVSPEKLDSLYRKVLALPQRVDSVKKLSDTLKTLITLERQAYAMDDTKSASDVLGDILKEIDGKTRDLVH